MAAPSDADYASINERLGHWRQGDCVLGESWFLFRMDPENPLSTAALIAAQDDSEYTETLVPGFMVTAQTCDLVRDCRERPFVEVCPLVEVESAEVGEIRKGRRPRYAFIPGVSPDSSLVADTDRLMTVEKAVVAKWERVAGCISESDSKELGSALGRKRRRRAFPNDFVGVVCAFTNFIKKKHDKKSDNGRALQRLLQIRVLADPSWDAANIRLTFYFIRDQHPPGFAKLTWPEFLKSCLDKIKETGRFVDVSGLVITLDDLTARDYVESDRLDLDHLSGPDVGK